MSERENPRVSREVLAMVMTEVMERLEGNTDLTFSHHINLFYPVTGEDTAGDLKRAAEWLARNGEITLIVPVSFDEDNEMKEFLYRVDIKGSELSVSSDFEGGEPGSPKDVRDLFRKTMLRITGVDVFPGMVEKGGQL